MKLTILEGREGRSDLEVILGVDRRRKPRLLKTEESLRNEREPSPGRLLFGRRKNS